MAPLPRKTSSAAQVALQHCLILHMSKRKSMIPWDFSLSTGSMASGRPAQILPDMWLNSRRLCGSATSVYAIKMFQEAFIATASHRESLEKISDSEGIIQEISESLEMNKRWENYVRQMPYAKDITFSETACAVRNVLRGTIISA